MLRFRRLAKVEKVKEIRQFAGVDFDFGLSENLIARVGEKTKLIAHRVAATFRCMHIFLFEI